MGTLKDAVAKAVTAVHSGVYRASGGRLGGRVAGMPVLLLTTVGRTTGRPHTVPLTYFPREESMVLVASYGGDDRHPSWYRNLGAHPTVEVACEGRRRSMTARTATPEEKAELWPAIVETFDGYRRYQDRTDRDIPLVVLSPA